MTSDTNNLNNTMTHRGAGPARIANCLDGDVVVCIKPGISKDDLLHEMCRIWHCIQESPDWVAPDPTSNLVDLCARLSEPNDDDAF